MTTKEYNQSVDQFSDSVFRFILSSTKNESLAKDIVQDTYEKLWIKVKTVEFEKVKANINKYGELLNQNNLTDNGIYSVLQFKSINLLSYLALPIYLLGFIINKPIKNFIEKSVQKKIKKDEFKLSIKMGFLLAIYHILALIVFSIAWLFIGIAWAFGSLILLYISSWWATLLNERYKLNKEIFSAKKFEAKNLEKFNIIAELRKNITNQFNITS